MGALAAPPPAQISCFGDDIQTDGGDVWTVEWDGKAKFWRQEQKVGATAGPRRVAPGCPMSLCPRRGSCQARCGQLKGPPAPPPSRPPTPQIRFKHTDTGVYMISHDAKFGQPIGGQQEICGIARKIREADWLAAEGVYYPRSDLADKEKQHEEL
jgi:hypothetical protein